MNAIEIDNVATLDMHQYISFREAGDLKFVEQEIEE